MSFGHCGIDWLHSLLDYNPEILILPELSFYRHWKVLGCDGVGSEGRIFSLWMHHFNSSNRQSSDVKMFSSEDESTRFSELFLIEIKKNGIGRKEIFKSIHIAYANVKKIKFTDIKVIIAHEHVSYPFKHAIEDFDQSKILMIIRDPRASLAGFFRGITKKVGHLPDYHEYYYNMSIEEWLNGRDIWKYNSNWLGQRLKIIQNENMVNDLKSEMKDLAKWLEIKFTEGLLKRTYHDGKTAFVDSSYLKKSSSLEKNYFKPENIRKRWLKELSDQREILMIETLFRDIMKSFGYKLIVKPSLFNCIKGIYYFLLPHRGPRYLMYYRPDEDEIKRTLNRLIISYKNLQAYILKHMPKGMQSAYIWLLSVINHIRIYFFPGNRWKRYDHPILDSSYRDY